MRFKQITVVGVGLIGGSFAVAARRAGISDHITGWDNDQALKKARSVGAIDEAETSFEAERVCESDLVYLAAPVGGILSFLRTRGKLLRPGTIVTDAGSTKREICRAAREALPPGVEFVGGHPMAGSEQSGIDFADPDLFRDAAYALVAAMAGSNAVRAVSDVVTAIGARPVMLTAEQHDRIAARISHLPQLLSTALALTIAKGTDPDTLALSGKGFETMTRLAESRWSVWQDICRTNADEIEAALDETIAEIEAVRLGVSSGEMSSLSEAFETAGELTRRLKEEKNRKG